MTLNSLNNIFQQLFILPNINPLPSGPLNGPELFSIAFAIDYLVKERNYKIYKKKHLFEGNSLPI
jgi:hypothetical protein